MSDGKILLVDDRPENLTAVEAILSPEHYEIIKATSGKQALQILLKQQDFNLILMDVTMPVLSGFETAALIYQREKLKKIPIIFITAHSYNDEVIYEGYKTGAVDYIYKPIKPELLRAKVSVFIDLYKKTEALMMQELKLKAANKSLESEVTERKHSEAEVKKLNDKLMENIHTLENANAELARFAYVASHDLQEPLRKIQTYGNLLETRYHNSLDEEGRQYIERMQKGSSRLQKLIKDILTYSRFTDSNTNFTKTNLNVLIDEILIDLEFKIKETGAQIKVDPLPELYVNPGQMTQLFQNIIGNALKFSRKDVTPEITITSEITNHIGTETPNGKEYCTISIHDNGVGFDESYLDQIFTLFKRLHDPSEYEGTGIGLAICKKIVEQHKGFITASSKPGEGATFLISLPYQDTTEHERHHRTKKNIERAYSG